MSPTLQKNTTTITKSKNTLKHFFISKNEWNTLLMTVNSMDTGGMNKQVPILTQLYRRLRYQGTTQWLTLLLAVSCVSLWMFASPLNSYLYQGDPALARPRAPSEAENTEGQNDLGDANFKANDIAAIPSNELLEPEINPEFTSTKFWDGVDWDEPMEMPDRVASQVFGMTVETGEEDVEMKLPSGEMQVMTVFYRESLPKVKSKGDVLLLHGARFTSETWVTVDTTKTLAAMGYRVTAIDLPGFGNTAGSVLFGERAVTFIGNFCEAHNIQRPIIVAPSMAGQYALPYAMARPYNVTALVTLVPTAPERFTPDQYYGLKIPVLLVYGSKDVNLGRQVAKAMSNIPNFQVRTIDDAHHAVFVDQPDEWHRVMFIFLRRLEFWFQKFENMTTTPHPPVVTPDAAETLPPEITFAPLNPPPPLEIDYKNKVIRAGTANSTNKFNNNNFGIQQQIQGNALSSGFQEQNPTGVLEQNFMPTPYLNGQPTNVESMPNVNAQPTQQQIHENYASVMNPAYAVNPGLLNAAVQQPQQFNSLQNTVLGNSYQNSGQLPNPNVPISATNQINSIQQPPNRNVPVGPFVNVNQNVPALPMNQNVPAGPNPNFNVLQNVPTMIKKVVPSNYPSGGFSPPNIINDTAIRIPKPPAPPNGMSEQQFKYWQEAAARQAIIEPANIPDIRPVPPYEATKEIHRDKLVPNTQNQVNQADTRLSGETGRNADSLGGSNEEKNAAHPYPVGKEPEPAQQPQIVHKEDKRSVLSANNNAVNV